MQAHTLSAQASLVTPSRKRFFIMVLLFITVVINYLDRSNLSIAAPAMTSELGIDPIHVGLIFSAFGWTYAAMQIPGGWLVDRVRYISTPSDYLMLVLLLAIGVSGMLMTFVAHTDIVALKAFFMGLMYLDVQPVPMDPILLVHLALVALLIAALSLTACGGSDDDNDAPAPINTPPPAPPPRRAPAPPSTPPASSPAPSSPATCSCSAPGCSSSRWRWRSGCLSRTTRSTSSSPSPSSASPSSGWGW